MHDGVTGGALVNELRVGAGDRVLVVGASGGLGIVLVQLAKSRGARVVALARDERKLARVRELGADAVVDAEAPGWAERSRTAPSLLSTTVSNLPCSMAPPGGPFHFRMRASRMAAVPHPTPGSAWDRHRRLVSRWNRVMPLKVSVSCASPRSRAERAQHQCPRESEATQGATPLVMSIWGWA